MPAVTLLLALVLAAPPKAAPPGCHPSTTARLDSPYVYAGAVIDVLGWMKQGIGRIPITGPRDVSEVVRAFRSARDDFACAARFPEPFRKSGSEPIRKADEAMSEFVIMTSFFDTVLIEFGEEKPTGRLLVTRAERQSLMSRLERKFGKAIGGGNDGDDDPVTTVAARWYRVLADPGMRPLDDA